jgi:ferrous iron transport protein A
MDLGELPPDTAGRVLAVGLDPVHRLRLAELGIRPGARLRVTHRAAFGGRVLAVGADRFALDAATCARIQVDAVPA